MASLVEKDISGVYIAKAGERELPKKRTRGFKTFKISGTRRRRIAGQIGPIHYRQDPFSDVEAWKEIDLDVALTPDQSWDASMETNGYQVRFWQSRQIAGKTVRYIARFSRAEKWLEMAPLALVWENDAGQRELVSKPVVSIDPTIDNDACTITWSNCFGSGIHYRYNMRPDHFFKTVIIDNKTDLPAPTISGAGLKLTVILGLSWHNQSKTANGFANGVIVDTMPGDSDNDTADEELADPSTVAYLDELSREVFHMRPPRGWDSSPDEHSVDMSWRLRRRGDRVVAALSIPASVLNSPSVVYPVFVDVDVSETVDAGYNDGYSYNGQYENGTDRRLRTNILGNFADANDLFALFRFDGVPIENGSTINTAVLSVRALAPSINARNTIYCEDILNSPSLEGANPLIDNRDLTSASTVWNASVDTAAYDDSPDISGAVSEVINTLGWIPSNALSVILVDTQSSQTLNLRASEGGVSVPKLVVDFTPPSNWVQVAPQLDSETRIYSLISFEGDLYAGTSPNGNLFRWNGTDAWTQVAPQLNSQTVIYDLEEHDGFIYGCTEGGRLFQWNGTDSWVQVAPQLTSGEVLSLKSFGGDLYGGTFRLSVPEGGRLYKWNGVDAWTEVAPQLNDQYGINGLMVFGGELYGTTISSGVDDPGRLYKFNGTDAWTQEAPRFSGQHLASNSMVIFESELYAGTLTNARLYKFNGTDAWTQEAANAFPTSIGAHSLSVLNGEIYAGTETLGMLLKWDGNDAWVVVADVLNAQDDIWALVVHNYKLYGGTGPDGRLFEFTPFGAPRSRVMGGGNFHAKRVPQHLPPSTAPQLLLHNTIEEDGDGGRESVLRWKGEQSGGELSTLATISGSHDGAADDEKGKLDFSVNTGSDGDTPTKLLTLDSNTGVIIQKKLTMTPSALTNITAAGGITVTNAHMRIQGDGGAIDITANPQIVAGTDGQTVKLEGGSNTDTVKLDNGDGLHLLGGSYTLRSHDYIVMTYDSGESEWQETARSAPSSEKAWGFLSQVAGTGTNYFGGFYLFNNGDDDFSATQTLGVANATYAAHGFLVLGADTVDDVTIRFSGTSIDDEGNRTGSDTQDVVFTHPALVDDYVETAKKWIGQVSIDLISGTAKTCNWGFAKYWDNQNSAYIVLGLEATWRGGANDNDPDLQLIHHKSTGWTYNVGSTPTPPAAIASMKTDHSPEYLVKNNTPGAWKRTDLNVEIDGGDGEGSIIAMVTNQNRTYELGNFLLRVRPN